MLRWRHVEISGGFLLVAALLFYLDTENLLFWAAAACALHELGHGLAIRCLGGRVALLRLTCVGAELKLSARYPMGYGRQLMETSFEKAAALGYDVIVIFGSPANYVARGFKSCKKFNVCADNGRYPAAMLVKELVPGALDGRKWVYRDSPVMAFSEEEAQRYDDTLEKLEKKWQPSQEEFYILSHSFVE